MPESVQPARIVPGAGPRDDRPLLSGNVTIDATVIKDGNGYDRPCLVYTFFGGSDTEAVARVALVMEDAAMRQLAQVTAQAAAAAVGGAWEKRGGG